MPSDHTQVPAYPSVVRRGAIVRVRGLKTPAIYLHTCSDGWCRVRFDGGRDSMEELSSVALDLTDPTTRHHLRTALAEREGLPDAEQARFCRGDRGVWWIESGGRRVVCGLAGVTDPIEALARVAVARLGGDQ